MSVVSGHPEYAATLAEMHAQCFERPWTEAEFQSLLRLPTTVCWLTEQGFLMCSVVRDELEILTVGVLPAYRRQHVGLELLNNMIAYADSQHLRRLFLEVSEQNEAARKLYERVGFVQTGIRPKYYQTEKGMVDALCLTLIRSDEKSA